MQADVVRARIDEYGAEIICRTSAWLTDLDSTCSSLMRRQRRTILCVWRRKTQPRAAQGCGDERDSGRQHKHAHEAGARHQGWRGRNADREQPPGRKRRNGRRRGCRPSTTTTPGGPRRRRICSWRASTFWRRSMGEDPEVGLGGRRHAQQRGPEGQVAEHGGSIAKAA